MKTLKKKSIFRVHTQQKKYNNFSSGHQLVYQTYIIYSYNCQDRIKICRNTPKHIPINLLRILTHVLTTPQL